MDFTYWVCTVSAFIGNASMAQKETLRRFFSNCHSGPTHHRNTPQGFNFFSGYCPRQNCSCRFFREYTTETKSHTTYCLKINSKFIIFSGVEQKQSPVNMWLWFQNMQKFAKCKLWSFFFPLSLLCIKIEIVSGGG